MDNITPVIRSFVNVSAYKVIPSAAVTVYGYNLTNIRDITKVGKLDKLIQAVTGQPVTVRVGDNGCHFTITVPNQQKSIIPFRDILCNTGYMIPCFVGKDTSNNPVVFDLAKQPHCLVSGTTGSGKSILLHDIISGIMATRSPEKVSFIMVDCKRTELTKYNPSRHLIAPAAIDPKQGITSLETVCRIMDNRYKTLEKSPYTHFTSIVIVIDELADLMLQAGKQAEFYLVRIAQLGRAAGIHLLLATQRPSRQVITGLLSANIPCKIALKASSVTDSIVSIGHKGAEALTGQGDCIVKTVTGTETRTQAAYITDPEIEYITSRV